MVDIVVTGVNTRTTGTILGSGQNQQIIVIPQSLLAQATGMSNVNKSRPILKVSPNVVVNSNISPKISLKRPLAPTSPDLKVEQPEEEEENGDQPVRKRANLDHLTPEEKLMRRKLKNRVAAQNARDKKRAKMDDMDDMIKNLEDEKEKLRKENERLMLTNQRLMQENQTLKGGLSSPSLDMVKVELPPSPPASLPPCSPASMTSLNHDQTVVVPAPSETAALTHELLPKGQGAGMAASSEKGNVEASLAAACLFWTCLVTSPLLSGNKNTSSRATLPLKKRSKGWWGAHQSAWNPARIT